MKIIVAGNGNMANALVEYCALYGIKCSRYNTVKNYPHDWKDSTVAVHFGSGRELAELINKCNKYSVPLIQGSTGQKLSKEVETTVVNAPNLSLAIIAFLSTLPTIAEAYKFLPDLEISVVESHQKTKESVPGTVKVIAKAFGVPEESIVSIRDDATALAMGVPPEHLKGHGYHWLFIRSNGITVCLSTKVNGRDTYCHGAIAIAKAILSHRTAYFNKVYEATHFIN